MQDTLRPAGASNIKAVIVMALAAAAGAASVRAIMPRLFGGGSVEQQLEEAAAKANLQLPQQLDEVTRCERVEAGPGKRMSYIYTLSVDFDNDQQKLLTEQATQRALVDPNLQPAFSAGVTLWYKYYDKSGKLMFEFPVRK